MEDPSAQPELNPMKSELQGDEHWPLSGKPYFHLIIGKSSVKPQYQMAVPAKLHEIIPSLVIPTVLTCRGKNWKMSFNGTSARHKKIVSGWRAFVDDNNLKVGDACVFELMECCSTKLIFRIQILRGDIPSELLDKVGFEGESSNAPIVID